jgi:hypothetical protein
MGRATIYAAQTARSITQANGYVYEIEIPAAEVETRTCAAPRTERDIHGTTTDDYCDLYPHAVIQEVRWCTGRSAGLCAAIMQDSPSPGNNTGGDEL